MGLLWGAVVCVLVAWVMGCSGPHATPSEQHGERGVAAFAALDKLSARQPNLVAIALPRPASRPAFTRDPGGGFVSEGWRAASEQRVDGLGAHLPPAADGVMSVGASRFDALHVRVRLEGARAESTAHLTEGRVVYEGALAGTDRVLASDGSSLEEFLVLRDARAPRAFVWNLQLPDPAPGSLVRVTEHDGAFRFENARGEPKLVMSAPVAYDAQGERVDLAVAWNAAAHTLRVTLPVNRELAFPVVVDPKYDLSVWFDTGTRLPAARNLHTMVFDSARNEVVLFGGFNQAQLNDTWVWSGASSTWTHRFPAVKPPARSFHVMAFDSVRGEVVLFGGVGTNGYLGDTWVWNGAAQTWTQRSPAVSPPARTSAALAFDSTRGEALLFGGANGALLNDTWGWNGTNWAQHMSATTPTARGNHALAFDSGRGEVVMFGGQVGNPPSTAVNETWVWNGTTWTRRNVTAPPARANHVLAFDAARGEVMLFGGLSTSTTAYNDTWAWNGATQTWVGRMPATSPGARQAHAGAFDTTRGELVTFGGLVGVGANAYGRDTWAWSSALQTWAKKSPLASPSARYGHTLVFDSNRKEVLLFGGWSGASSNETWVWNGATQSWAQRTPAVSPPPRFAHAVAFDSARNEVVLFGGFGYWDDTWVWDGTAQTWTARAPPSRPRGRDAHAMVFDSARGEVVLFGGYSSAGYENDTWVWNGAAQTWTQRLPSMPPAGRGGHALIYDPARQETVLFAGIVNGSRVNDTWVWNGTAQTWTQRTPAASPPARGDHRLAFDLARQETVMFGGSALTPFNDTWVWSGSPGRSALRPHRPALGKGSPWCTTASTARSCSSAGSIVSVRAWAIRGFIARSAARAPRMQNAWIRRSVPTACVATRARATLAKRAAERAPEGARPCSTPKMPTRARRAAGSHARISANAKRPSDSRPPLRALALPDSWSTACVATHPHALTAKPATPARPTAGSTPATATTCAPVAIRTTNAPTTAPRPANTTARATGMARAARTRKTHRAATTCALATPRPDNSAPVVANARRRKTRSTAARSPATAAHAPRAAARRPTAPRSTIARAARASPIAAPSATAITP